MLIRSDQRDRQGAASMHHIVYMSRAIGHPSHSALTELCEQSTAHNKTIGVTGLLVYDGLRYMQLIEGEHDAVRVLMTSIAADERHDKIVYSADDSIATRAFAGWGLACIGIGENQDAVQLLAAVKAQVNDIAEPKLMAGFIGFAALARGGPRQPS